MDHKTVIDKNQPLFFFLGYYSCQSKRPRRSVMWLNIWNKNQCTCLAIQNIILAWDCHKKRRNVQWNWYDCFYLATDNHLLNLRTWELSLTIMPIICAMIARPLQSKFTYLSPFNSYNCPVWLRKYYLHFNKWEKWSQYELSDLS